MPTLAFLEKQKELLHSNVQSVGKRFFGVGGPTKPVYGFGSIMAFQ